MKIDRWIIKRHQKELSQAELAYAIYKVTGVPYSIDYIKSIEIGRKPFSENISKYWIAILNGAYDDIIEKMSLKEFRKRYAEYKDCGKADEII